MSVVCTQSVSEIMVGLANERPLECVVDYVRRHYGLDAVSVVMAEPISSFRDMSMQALSQPETADIAADVLRSGTAVATDFEGTGGRALAVPIQLRGFRRASRRRFGPITSPTPRCSASSRGMGAGYSQSASGT